MRITFSKIFFGLLIMSILGLGFYFVSGCNDEVSATAPQSKVVHKITQAERLEYTDRYEQLKEQNPTLSKTVGKVKGFSFFTEQILESIKANPKGRIFVEYGASKDGAPTQLITIYSETGDVVDSYEGGLPCPPCCPICLE